MRKTLVVLLLVAVLIGAFVSCKEEPAHEHTWDAGKVTTPATCEKAGVKTYTCSCGETKTEAIPALGHDYSTEWTIDTPATCTDPGSKSHHCSRCTSKSDVTPIEATGHTYSDEWSSDADNHWHAATCGHDVKSDNAAHTWGDWVTTPATTFTEGSKKRTCSVCSAEENEVIPRIPIEVATFAEFKAAFDTEREEGAKFIIKLTADVEWEGTTFAPNATGITIDLGGHTISNIPKNSFALSGNSFTLKNGTIQISTSATGTYLKGLNINFADAMTGKDYTSEEEQAKAVTLDGIVLNCALYLGDGVYVLNDCTIETDFTQTRGICIYSGALTLNNTTVRTIKKGSNKTEVALYGREAIFNLNAGTVIESANHGIQPYNNSTLVTTGDVTITAAGNYAIYTNYASYTRDDGKYKNAVTLGAGAKVTSGVNGIFAMTFGDVYTIENGVTLTGPEGTVEPVYTATSIGAASGTSKSNNYIGWSAGKGETVGNATITDNRVL